MNEEALSTVNGLKTAHANRVVAAIIALRTEMASEPELWFGGNPPAFEELDRMLDMKVSTIRQVFGLDAGQ